MSCKYVFTVNVLWNRIQLQEHFYKNVFGVWLNNRLSKHEINSNTYATENYDLDLIIG